MTIEKMHQPLATRWKNREYLELARRVFATLQADRALVGPVDLRGLRIGAPDSIDVFRDAHFHGCHVSEADLRFSWLSCSFVNSILRNVELSSSTFDRCRFMGAKHYDTRFSSSRFISPSLAHAEFHGCNFRSARFEGRGAIIANKSGHSIRFSHCDFSEALFTRIDIRNVQFNGCRFDGALIKRCLVFNWHFSEPSSVPSQFIDCEFRGRNVGLEAFEG